MRLLGIISNEEHNCVVSVWVTISSHSCTLAPRIQFSKRKAGSRILAWEQSQILSFYTIIHVPFSCGYKENKYSARWV